MLEEGAGGKAPRSLLMGSDLAENQRQISQFSQKDAQVGKVTGDCSLSLPLSPAGGSGKETGLAGLVLGHMSEGQGARTGHPTSPLTFDLGHCQEKGGRSVAETSGHWGPSNLCVQCAATVPTASAWDCQRGAAATCLHCVLSVSAAFRQHSQWLSILKHREARTKDQGRIRDD